ncbi:MAG: DUF262 and DUF1524 domain-containing protein [Caldilineaceae bacterium]|nr:DUF262 and DUF1524 domain-containing protein [Caldilineaceae bacterium]
MKATEAKLLGFLRQSPQFAIPIYQRTYSWTEEQCSQLWDDIVRAGKNESIRAHFIGSIVYIQDSLFQVSAQSPLQVIDGQQRLTTVSLLIEALARHVGCSEPVEGFSARKLRSYYLLNTLEDGEQRYKLILTQTDKETLLALVDQQETPQANSLRIDENFNYFEERIKKLGGDIEPLCRGLDKLMLVDISLNRDHDNPQLIFESMNSTGLALSQADLIRNYVLMGLDRPHQEKLYSYQWRPMELAFGQEAYGTHFDSFMRHYLTLKTGEIPNKKKVYEEFKRFVQRQGFASIDPVLVELRKFADHYCAMALDKESEPRLAAAFRDLRDLRVDVAFPFLLELYNDYANGGLPLDDFVQALRYIESYVFRRAVCSVPANSLNKTFASFSRFVNKDRYLESILAYFQWLPSYRRFPKDEEFVREIKQRDLYKNRASYWLHRLENHGRKEPVMAGEYTVEHILPQNENLSIAWQDALGPDWQSVREKWLHTLGNLTLTGYNSEYSDRPFAEKRDMKGGFGQSTLQLNQGLAQQGTWNEQTIQDRAARLANLALEIWQAPLLSPDVLANYGFHARSGSKRYTILDHQHLLEGKPTRQLFEKLRGEVCAIDNCVEEEFLKLYVAYKAETNFVDVVPQASGLRLSLNMKFHELNDPRRMAEDVTKKGRWGNGDVELKVATLEELPYVMNLVRQSFERQMVDGEEQE